MHVYYIIYGVLLANPPLCMIITHVQLSCFDSPIKNQDQRAVAEHCTVNVTTENFTVLTENWTAVWDL